MQTLALEVGEVVFSVAGRDRGKFYVVTSVVDDCFVTIVNGELRRVAKPKLKKLKHLKSLNIILEKIKDKLIEGKTVFDAEIRNALKSYNG